MTRFYTINGQILYQTDSSGNRTEYVHDALGSVIATTDANRNAAEHLSLGALWDADREDGYLTRSRFPVAWNLGYRATGRAHAGSYVRARHVGFEQVSWTSVDGFWLSSGPYGYCHGSPAFLVDPSGYDPTIVTSSDITWPNKKTDCLSEADKVWKFTLTGGAGWSGWLIQKITITADAGCCVNCDGCVWASDLCRSCGSHGGPVTYYEAWFVIDGVVAEMYPGSQGGSCLSKPHWFHGSGPNDTWLLHGIKCSQGTWTIKGELGFYGGPKGNTPLPKEFVCLGDPGHVDCSAALPSTCVWNPTASQWTPTKTDNGSYSWECCQPGPKKYASCCGNLTDTDTFCDDPICT